MDSIPPYGRLPYEALQQVQLVDALEGDLIALVKRGLCDLLFSFANAFYETLLRRWRERNSY